MDVDALVAQYLVSLQAEGKTPHTIRWHRQSLKQFVAWLDASDHPGAPDRWTAPMLRSYVVFHQERTTPRGTPLSGSALNSLVRSLRAFCTWLRDEELVERDLFARVSVPRAPRLVKETLSPDEARRLLAVARRPGRNSLRDEALLLFLLDTGARANEVCTLGTAGIDWERGIAKLFGKGRKERYVPFSAPTAKAMRRYAAKARRGNSDRFFETEEGWPLTPSGLGQILKRLGARAGVHVGPHKCRHTFGISYLRSGGSVFALQKLLGHSSLDTTLRYAALVTDDLVNEHRDHSPVACLLLGHQGGRRRN